MKRIITLLFLVAVFVSSAWCENFTFKVFFNTNLCINCYGGLRELNDLPKSVNLVFVSHIGEEQYVDAILKKYKFNRIYQVEGAEYDFGSILKCQFLANNTKVLEFKIEEFDSNIGEINKIAQSLIITDSISFGSNFIGNVRKSYYNNGQLILFDYLLNKVVKFDIKNRRVTQISGDDFSFNKLISKIGIDSLAYGNRLKSYNFRDMSSVRIESVWASADSLYFRATINVIDSCVGNNVIFGLREFIFTYKDSEIISIKSFQPNVKIGDDEYVPIYRFCRYNNIWYSRLLGDTTMNTHYVIGKYKQKGDSILFNKPVFELPPEMRKKYGSSFSSMIYHNGIFATKSYPIIYFLGDSTSFNYQNILNLNITRDYSKKTSDSYWVIDTYIEGSNIFIIYKYNNELHYACINKKQNALLFNNKIYCPSQASEYGIHFITNSSFISYSIKNKNFYFLKMPN